MADWMDEYLIDDNRKRDDSLSQFAIACTPAMTKRLMDQLKNDVDRYAARKSDPIRIFADAEGAKITRDGIHPTIVLKLFMDAHRQPLIHCQGEISKNPRSLEPIVYDVHIVAKAQDSCFYSVHGRDNLNESQAAAEILKPLLNLLRA
jgi:hypothetical protein